MSEIFKEAESLIVKPFRNIFGGKRIDRRNNVMRNGSCKIESSPIELGQFATYCEKDDKIYLSSNLIATFSMPLGRNGLIHEICHSYNPALDEDFEQHTEVWCLFECITEAMSRLTYKQIFNKDLAEGNYDGHLPLYSGKVISFFKNIYNIDISFSFGVFNLTGNISAIKDVLLDKKLIEKVKNHSKT